MATINDKFTKAADGTGTYPAVASVTQLREAQGDTLTCDDLSGWPTDTAVHFTTFRVLADGKIDTSVQTAYKGIVVENTITQVTRIAGAEDGGHLVGDKVEINPTVGWVADLVEGMLKSHNQDGTLKDDIIQTRNLADASVKAQNIDFTTINFSSVPVIAYYLNGKPVKRIYLELSLTNKVTSNAYNMTGKTLVKLEGTLQYGDNNMAGRLPLNFKESSDYYFVGYVKGDHYLHLEYNDRNNTTSPRKCWLTIDYIDD